MPPIGVPTVRGLKDAAGDYAVGAGGGLLMALAQSVFGNGFLGSLGAALLGGTVVKGSRGETLALMAGFRAGAEMGVSPSGGADVQADQSQEVM